MCKDRIKIISLLPSATEIVCALGLGEDLVGVTHECDFPPGIGSRPHLTASKINHERSTSREIDHAVRSQLDGHGSIYTLDEDLLAELSPDLILTQELCEVCAVSYRTVSAAARVCAANAEIVSLEPNTVEDIYSNILTVGEVAGVRETAEDLVLLLRERFEDLKAITCGLNRPRVMMLEWLDPPFTPGHWVPEQVEAAGGFCLLGEAGQKSSTTTYPAVAESNADVLVLIPCGYSTADILRQLEITFFPEVLRHLPAIRNDNVWAMDASAYFSRPGPRVIDGAEVLAKILHPEILGAPTELEAVRIDITALKFSG